MNLRRVIPIIMIMIAAVCAIHCGCANRSQSSANAEAAQMHGHDHWAFHSHGPAAVENACECSAAKAHNGWCGACHVGYVASVQIRSADLFDVIDAHGHDFIAQAIE